MRKIFLQFLYFSFISAHVHAQLSVGRTPPTVVLAAGNGGQLQNGDWNMWSSESLKGKVHIVFHVAPSEKALNQHIADKIKEQNYPLDQVKTLVIVNTASSWWPDSVLEHKIKSNQEENPRALYLKDTQYTVSRTWGLPERSNDVLVFDANGQLLFFAVGALSEQQSQNMFQIIEKNRTSSNVATPKRTYTRPETPGKKPPKGT